MVHPGEGFDPFISVNTGLGPDGDAIITGSTTALSYALYSVNSTLFSDQATLAQIGVDVRWDGAEPLSPEGVWVGLPDHANDRWQWVQSGWPGPWLDITVRNLHGLDPIGGLPSYIAVVNFSSEVAHIDELRLRFNLPTTVPFDEYLYYTSRDPAAGSPLFTSVSRVPILSGAPEPLFETDGATNLFLAPMVIDHMSTPRLLHARKAIGDLAATWMSNLDGTSALLAGDDSTAEVYPAGWNVGDDRGLLIHFYPGGSAAELWAADTTIGEFEYGRLSQGIDFIGNAVWDISIDPATTGYGAIASVRVDEFEDRYGIVSYSGNPPFNIDATPIQLYPFGILEDARDPQIV
jgi:hypothetical protein